MEEIMRVFESKDETINTTRCEGLTTIRRDGNTTRQVDFAIQKLFEGYNVACMDHYVVQAADIVTSAQTRKINQMLLDKIMTRLQQEYHLGNEKRFPFRTIISKEYHTIRLQKI
jgi:hypothetical protein